MTLNWMRSVAGAVIWVILLAAAWLTFGRQASEQGLVRQLLRHALGRNRTMVVRVEPPQILQVGDPIYAWPAQAAGASPIGRVVRVGRADSRTTEPIETDLALVILYPRAPRLSPHDKLSVVTTPQSLGWVIETMLPPETRRRMGEIMVEAWTEHREVLIQELKPIVLAALQESAVVFQEDLAAAWQRHREEFIALAGRYQDEYLVQQVFPVFQREVWPIMVRETQPLIEQIGVRLWERVSVFGFSWRYLYDLSPLPQRDLVRREFARFVEQEASPILVESIPALMLAQQRILEAAVNHPRVQDVFAQGLQRLAQDAEVQRLLITILQETLIANPRMQAVWQRAWVSPEAQAAFDRIGRELEPSIVAIGELLFGNPNTEITPQFSRVLRNRVLLKDGRWLVLELADDPGRGAGRKVQELTARPGDSRLLDGFNPFHVPATPRE